MKKILMTSVLFLALGAGSALPASAQTETATTTETAIASTSATTTEVSTAPATIPATTTAAVAAPAAASIALPATGLPEWGNDSTRQSHIWKWAAQSIRESVADLPVNAEASLPIPVLFGANPANLTRNFGDARGGGRIHEGLDIVVAKGTPIVSPTRAVVLGTGYGSDSGYYAYTANPGGETFVYMHLDRATALIAGNRLEPGNLIGFAGNTGNASGTGAHLHFEIRKNGATNPYPRLTSEFSATQKMSFLTAIFASSSDKIGLAKLLVANYPAEFNRAKNANVLLPVEIDAELNRIALAVTSGSLWTGLGIGSRGGAVVDLQNYLIGQNKGPAAAKLAATGATGYFGTLTQNALAEYKSSANTSTAATVAPVKMTQAQILARIAQIKVLLASLIQQLEQLRAKA